MNEKPIESPAANADHCQTFLDLLLLRASRDGSFACGQISFCLLLVHHVPFWGKSDRPLQPAFIILPCYILR